MKSCSLFGFLTVMGALSAVAGRAGAQAQPVHVQRWYTGPCSLPCAASPCPSNYGSGDPISLEVNACTYRINVWADNTTYDIGSIQLTLETGSQLPLFLELFIGQGDFPYSMQQSTAVAGNLGVINIMEPGLPQRIRFAGHITGNALGVIVGRVYRFDVDGELHGISAQESPEADQLFRVFAGVPTAGALSSPTPGRSLGSR